jgi:PIN domain nuclease of toxin-antitoxin system
MVYLTERGRVPIEALHRLQSALKNAASGVVITPVDTGVAEAVSSVPRDIVPDMPDRIVGATARHLGFPLVTRDRRLQSGGIRTIW